MKNYFYKIRKSVTNYCSQRLLQVRLYASGLLWQFGVRIGYFALSIFGVTLAILIIFVPGLRVAVDSFQPLEAILSQLGATFGTILALVLTLSIIPIQRAGEVWSSSIVYLYRRDIVTYVIFLVLGIFCVASFLLAVRGLAHLSVSSVLAGALAMLAISLDMLRWYHRHTCLLLDPTHAVTRVLRQAKRKIDRISALVTHVAKLQYQLLEPSQKDGLAVEDLETAIYPRVAGYPNVINAWINDLTEIATKAVARGERHLAKTAVYSIASLTNHYLSVRTQNLIVTPVPGSFFLAKESDVNAVMSCAYEALQDVSRAAVSQGDEFTAVRVSEVYQSIAIHTANLGARAFCEHTAPLTGAPIFYALNCVKYAQTKGLDEVPFQTAAILSGIAIVAPKDISETDINVPILNGLYEIAAFFYGKRSFGLAEEINGHQFTILAHLIQQKNYYFKDTLRHILEKMELLAPLAILNEAMEGHLSTVQPLCKAYGLVNQSSLGYLFGMAAEALPIIDSERDWLNPYRELVEIADIISNHLRRIAEKNEFGESFIVWEINQLIKHIAKVIVRLIDRPLRPGRGDESSLIDKLGWVLAFYWVAFRGKKAVSARHADDCSESLVFIGLLFYERGYPDVFKTSISNICSILESYCEITRQPDYYVIGDILAHLWSIRMLLIARNDSNLVPDVDHRLATKPSALTDEQWQYAQDAILLRRRQLEDRMSRFDDCRWPDEAETLLYQLLHRAQ